MFGSSAILKDETIEFLSSLGKMMEREHFSSALVGQWKWEARYGGELFGLLLHEDVGVFVAQREPGVSSQLPNLMISLPSRASSRLR
jgi:hypothetical protein